MLDARRKKLQKALEDIKVACVLHETAEGHKLVETDLGVWCSHPGCTFKRFWGTILHQLRTGIMKP